MAQQDKIIGYFLDEAQEHLRVIEESLVTPNFLSQPTHIKEVFRAAHSIKGGAAMLELDTIEKIGRHFEQAFKQIKEQSLSVDERLQNLLLEGFEILSLALQILRHQQTPPDSLAQEEVFDKIHQYLGNYEPDEPIFDNTDFLPNIAIEKAFSSYVNHNLRQFENLSRRPSADHLTRAALSDVCQKIGDLGKDFNFVAWTNLLNNCQLAINNPLVQMDQLRNTIPYTIKQAQLLVINGNYHAIVNPPELNELIEPAAQIDLTAASLMKNLGTSESSLWLDEASLNVETKINSYTSDSNIYDDTVAGSTIDPFDLKVDLEKSSDNYNLGEFMQLFDEEIIADGTWVQDEDILAFDHADKLIHAEENLQTASLWDEDIFERPIPILTLDLNTPNSSLADRTELKPTVNLPQFNFEEPSHSELFMEDDIKTDCSAPHLNTSSVNHTNGQEIDWSGLLADIPDEAIVDYQEPLTSSPKTDEWSVHSIGNHLNPVVPIINIETQNVETQSDTAINSGNFEEEIIPQNIFDIEDQEEESAELTATDLAQPIVIDFTVEHDPAQKDLSVLETDDFHQIAAAQPINQQHSLIQDQDDLILDVFEFDDDQFTFDFSSQPSTDLEISNIFSVKELPIVNTSNLPTLDELMSKSLNISTSQSKPISSPPEGWRELSVFDELLADTQTTDADIVDLNQIMINGNLDPELELENMEDLSDFLQASVSSNQLDAFDSFVRVN